MKAAAARRSSMLWTERQHPDPLANIRPEDVSAMAHLHRIVNLSDEASGIIRVTVRRAPTLSYTSGSSSRGCHRVVMGDCTAMSQP